MTPPGWGPYGPQGHVWQDHYTLLLTKYESSGSCDFGEDFSNDAPGEGPVWTPGARLVGFIKRTTIHC